MTAEMDLAAAGRLAEGIGTRAAAIRARIAERTDRDVTLVCVTKAHPPEVAAAALLAGLADLGENYAQELRDKARLIPPPDGVRWHFIGRLQTNKVRMVAPVVTLWQSVDRASLATEVARRAPGARVLVQLDLAGLPERGGCPPAEAADLVAHCRGAGLQVEGLMGVGPPGDPEDARPGFRLLSSLADDLALPVRSMGMSHDLDVAVEEGSTMVRIGSALVGARPPR
ncbi:MAG: YggS family pyridoxal phosphate-dependent enzyme [Microthrixaceae bacterium]